MASTVEQLRNRTNGFRFPQFVKGVIEIVSDVLARAKEIREERLQTTAASSLAGHPNAMLKAKVKTKAPVKPKTKSVHKVKASSSHKSTGKAVKHSAPVRKQKTNVTKQEPHLRNPKSVIPNSEIDPAHSPGHRRLPIEKEIH